MLDIYFIVQFGRPVLVPAVTGAIALASIAALLSWATTEGEGHQTPSTQSEKPYACADSHQWLELSARTCLIHLKILLKSTAKLYTKPFIRHYYTENKQQLTIYFPREAAVYSGSGNRRGSLLEITGLSVLIHLSVSIFLFNGGGNPSDIYLWWVLWISRCRTRRSSFALLALRRGGGLFCICVERDNKWIG